MSLSDDDKQWIRELMGGVREELLERLEAVETRLLTEFHKWASPLEARHRTHSAAIRAIDVELESLDDRVKKLESNPPSTM